MRSILVLCLGLFTSSASASNATILYCSSPGFTLIANRWNEPTPPIVVLMYTKIEDSQVVENEKSAYCDEKDVVGGYSCPIEISADLGYTAYIISEEDGTFTTVLDPKNRASDSDLIEMSCEEY